MNDSQLRARHDALEASYLVGGQAVRPEQLSVRSMNFGQHWRTPGVVEVTYELTLPRSYVIEHLDAELPEYVADSLEHPDATNALENALRAAGWPPARTILEDEALTRLTLAFFAHDMLLRWLGDGPPTLEPSFVLNTVSAERRRGGVPVFEGVARRSGPVRYQDV